MKENKNLKKISGKPHGIDAKEKSVLQMVATIILELSDGNPAAALGYLELVKQGILLEISRKSIAVLVNEENSKEL